jgi:5-methylcytosine-specific restriction endonuclease McrA
MTGASPATVKLVRERALDRCEYCLMHQSLQVATFHIEHIVPESAGGLSSIENLALACPTCNLHKADRVLVEDPETLTWCRLFHPRQNDWHEHFACPDTMRAGRRQQAAHRLRRFN